MHSNTYILTKLKRLSVIVTLLSLAACCAGMHTFEECAQETVTQEVEFLSTRQEEIAFKSSRTTSAVFRPLVMASYGDPSETQFLVCESERSSINGLGTYLRL